MKKIEIRDKLVYLGMKEKGNTYSKGNVKIKLQSISTAIYAQTTNKEWIKIKASYNKNISFDGNVIKGTDICSGPYIGKAFTMEIR